jgi:hypothetical protein
MILKDTQTFREVFGGNYHAIGDIYPYIADLGENERQILASAVAKEIEESEGVSSERRDVTIPRLTKSLFLGNRTLGCSSTD